jgi:hypothetical protein
MDFGRIPKAENNLKKCFVGDLTNLAVQANFRIRFSSFLGKKSVCSLNAQSFSVMAIVQTMTDLFHNNPTIVLNPKIPRVPTVIF